MDSAVKSALPAHTRRLCQQASAVKVGEAWRVLGGGALTRGPFPPLSRRCHTAAFESHSKVCQKPSWEEVLALVRLNFKLQNYKGVVEWTHRAGELLHYADEEGRKVIQDMFDTSAEEVEKAWE
jgi:hypothetical protein